MTILVLLVLGTGLYLYSLKCLDAPISPGFRLAITTARLIFLILLLLLLTKPQITELQKISQFPSLFVAIDDSHSMSYAIDPLSGKNASSRIDLTVDNLRDSILPTLQKQGYAMRFSLFSSFGDEKNNPDWSPHLPQSVQADFGYTDLAAVIASFDRQRNQDHAAYLLLFTDGQWNRGPNPMAVAINPGPGTAGVTQFSDRRIYSFGIGTTRSIFDIMIDQVQFPSLSREQEPLTLTAHVMAKGALPQQPVPIRVQGVSQDQEVVFTQEEFIVFDEENRKQTLEFDIPSLTVGEYVFSVNIELQEGELFEDNNRLDKGIRIRKSKDRVLLFTSAPDWDFKFLKRVYENQGYLEVDAYLNQEEKLFRLGDRNWVRKQTAAPGEQIAPIPTLSSLGELERMKDWSLIVLHNFSFTAAHEDFASQLRKYIEEGGSVLFLPGDHTASIPPSLRDILPAPMSIPHSIRLQTVFVDPQSMAGATMLKTLQAYKSSDLPPLIPLFLPTAASIGGNVLLYGQASGGERVDLMKQHRFGLGRIVTLASNAFWRWGLQTEHDILPSFWLAVLYQCRPHLSKDEGELYTDGFLYEIYQPMKIFFAAKAGIGDATIGGVPVVISHATREETVWLNPSEDGGSLFETVYTPVEPGDYQLVNQLADASAEVRVEANLIELNDLSQNSRDLREIAENSGGTYANYQAWKALIDSLPKTAKTQIEEQNRFLGEKWWMVVLLIGLLGFEWYMRWRKGLP